MGRLFQWCPTLDRMDHDLYILLWRDLIWLLESNLNPVPLVQNLIIFFLSRLLRNQPPADDEMRMYDTPMCKNLYFRIFLGHAYNLLENMRWSGVSG